MTLCTELCRKPLVTIDEARQFLSEKWSFLQITNLTELVSYDYRTYLVKSSNGKYIFKIVNEKESRNNNYFDALTQILEYMEDNGIHAQRLVKSSDNGESILSFPYQNTEIGQVEILKSLLLTYVEGEIVANMQITSEQCQTIGRELNKLTTNVDNIQPMPLYFQNQRDNNIWRLDNAELIKDLIPHIETSHQRHLLTLAISRFEQKVKPILGNLKKGFVHGDPNESNIIIGHNKEVCFIDWQDIGYSYKVYDLAILIFAMIIVDCKSLIPLDIEEIGRCCLEGYLNHDPSSLNEFDINILANLVECRCAVSLCVGQYIYKFLNPGNEYLLTTAKNGWTILEDFIENDELYVKKWKTGLNLHK